MTDAVPRSGEYKVPGGKLVRVDLVVAGGRIAAAHVCGDFFIEPDEALADLDAALAGVPVDLDSPALAERLAQGLRPGARLIGFDTLAVAQAVGRALELPDRWQGLSFDVIAPQVLAAADHVALDEVLLGEVSAGRRPAVLRFWDWAETVVVIGSFQSVRNEVDEIAAARHGVSIVRRITGGGAMFMAPANCVTYSLVVPGWLVEGISYEASYAFLDQWVLGALAGVGVDAHFEPLNDIASARGKIGGAAQRRLADGTVLHHATLAYDIDTATMLEVLRTGREKLSDKGITSAVRRVDPMRAQTAASRQGVIDALAAAFQGRYHCQPAIYSPDELAAASALSRTKFTDPAWTYRVP